MTGGEKSEKRHEIAANLNFALFEIPRSPRLQPLFAKTRPRAERYSKIRIAMRCGIHQRKYPCFPRASTDLRSYFVE